MLYKITKAVCLVLLLYGTRLTCMENKGKEYIRHIEVFNSGEEVIFEIEESIRESLDELFKDFEELIQNGKYFEAKKALKKYCSEQIHDLNLQSHESLDINEDLNELLNVFESNSKVLLKNLNNNFNVVKVGCDDTLRIIGFFGALSIGLASLFTLDSGFFLLALAIAITVCCDPIKFFGISMIVGLIASLSKPQLIFNLIIFISIVLVVGLAKIVSKINEKNKETRAFKKIVSGFKEKLKQQILLRHSLRTREN